MAKVRAYSFSGLPKYSAEHIAIQESMALYLSRDPFSPQFGESLSQNLEKFLKAPCSFAGNEMRPLGRRELQKLLPKTGVLVVVGAAPTEHKIIADLDPSLAAYVIERLLGGSGESARIKRPLTEIEEGVLSFVVLKALSHFHQGWSTGRELALTLDRFASKLEDIEAIVEGESGYYMVGVSIGVGKRVGYCRILIPNALIVSSFASNIPQGGASPQDLVWMRRNLNALGEAAIMGRVEAAQIDLGPDDIASLEPGDIVLLENHQLTKTPEMFKGEVFVKVGTGNNGGLRGHVADDGEGVRLQITEIVIQEQPQEAQMADGEPGPEGGTPEEMSDAAPPGPDDNLGETEGLLRDVPAPVIVELGRIKLNTSQVVRLRAGQILRLPRGPNDPVDLVVHGKVFARGELIEVDGELGVRLLQVTGQ